MKHLKLYEDFNFDEDDFDFEEENYLSDDDFKFIKYEFNDNYCHDHHRYWLYNINKMKVVRTISNDSITYSDRIMIDGRIKEINPIDFDKIKNGTIWITNNSADEIDTFRKWKYDELKDKFNIII